MNNKKQCSRGVVWEQFTSTYRREALSWTLGVIDKLKLTPVMRDFAFELLDTFFYNYVHTDPITREFVSYCAMIALTNAVKMVDPDHSFTSSIFTYCDLNEIESQQKTFSFTVDDEIKRMSIVSPHVVCHQLLSQWKTHTHNADIMNSVLIEADIALIEFLLDDSSIYYGPTTIAVCSLITAFSLVGIKCQEFLRNVVPHDIFTNGNNVSAAANIEDFDLCIKIFNKFYFRRKKMKDAYSKKREVRERIDYPNQTWYLSYNDTKNKNDDVTEKKDDELNSDVTLCSIYLKVSKITRMMQYNNGDF